MVQNDCLAIVADSQAAAGIQVPLELSWGEVTEQDWEAQVRASYVPLQLADDLWIIPEWCARRLTSLRSWMCTSCLVSSQPDSI